MKFFKRKNDRLDAISERLVKFEAQLSELPTSDELRGIIKEQNGLIIAMGAFAESDSKIFEVYFEGIRTQFWLPFGASDRTQTDIIRTTGFYQPRPLRFIRQKNLIKEGDRVVDVGGNIGNHTLFFGNIMRAGEVITFEPNPMVLPILKKNIELNSLESRVVLHEIGLGSSEGRGRNNIPTTSHIGRNEVVEEENGDVVVKRLDDIVSGKIDFLKVDVEGHGGGVILGGWDSIKNSKPAILIEATSESELDAVSKLKAELGYRERKQFGHDVLLTV